MKRILLILFVIAFINPPVAVFAQTKTNLLTSGDSLYFMKDFTGAIALYTAYINKNRADKYKLANGLDKRAIAELSLKMYKEVINDENEALAANPVFGNAYWNRGFANANLGNLNPALADYNKAISYYQNSPASLSTLLYNRAMVYRRLNNYKNAIEDYTNSFALNKEKTGVYFDRAVAHSLNKEYQLAIDDFTSALFYNQQNNKFLAIIYFLRGQDKAQLPKLKDAINDFNLALNLNPDMRDVYTARAYALKLNGDYELSSNDYTRAMQFYQDDKKKLSLAFEQRADNNRSLYLFEKALQDVTQAVNLNPESGTAYWTRASIYSQTGECKLAIDDFGKALSLFRGNDKASAYIHNAIANEWYVLKDDKKVVEECAATIALYSSYASPYFLRGKVYLKRIVDKTAAMNDFNKAIALDTSKSSTSYIFSQLYTGHTELAMELLQKQVLKNPNPNDALNHYYNIACIFSIINDADHANIYLKKAIEAGYSKKFAGNDEDFDNIRNTPEYIATMATVVNK